MNISSPPPGPPTEPSVCDGAAAMSLGATLYVPILHPAIREIAAGERYPHLRSVVLCLEDALRVDDNALGLRRVAHLLERISASAPGRRPWRFVRPRNIEMAEFICGLRGIDRIDGLVVPKLKVAEIGRWWGLAAQAGLRLMPTLECAWALDPVALSEFAAELDAQDSRHLLALRLGGNDLLGRMNLRRMRGETIYDGPLAWGMSQMMCQLGARGYPLTAPVFDILDDTVTLARECARDAAFGFVGKTAVHPDQIAIIHRGFAVAAEELAVAREVLSVGARAVFRSGGVMMEPATHARWARRIQSRAATYGLIDEGAPEWPMENLSR